MATTCSVVIGAGLGDCGKGKYTDILSNKPNSLTIRFNGGPQAAHTVVTPDGMRHVFRHIGAGSFNGAATYLTSDFLINPVAFVIEYAKLRANFKISPVVFVNEDAPVTTLFDMYINQAVEEYRDKSRHGSCGMGIWETVERTNNKEYEIRVRDLYFRDALKEKLKKIRDIYVPKRLKEEYKLSLSDFDDGLYSEDYSSLLSSDDTIEEMLFYVAEFLALITIRDDTVINCFKNIVFEGAQGLGLDENNPDCSPDFLTPSTTGVTNAMKVLKNAKYAGIPDIYYISRCYATRHGMGPLEHEVEGTLYKRVEDPTNITNKFQGSLRFAYIDFDMLNKRIKRDIAKITIPSRINLGFTCLDQLDEPFGIGTNKGVIKYQSNDFIHVAKAFFKLSIPNLAGVSGTYGLTRDEFEEF